MIQIRPTVPTGEEHRDDAEPRRTINIVYAGSGPATFLSSGLAYELEPDILLPPVTHLQGLWVVPAAEFPASLPAQRAPGALNPPRGADLLDVPEPTLWPSEEPSERLLRYGQTADELVLLTTPEYEAGWRERIGKQCRLLFVVPDYFEERPKACMNGWGSVFLSIAPDGLAMPCHNARDLPGLQLPNVREQPIADIWQRSQAFNAYRGQDWMQEPCRSCDERYKDFGGCRCQAFMVTGDAAATDPVCSKSPQHEKIVEFVRRAPERRQSIPIIHRSDPQPCARA